MRVLLIGHDPSDGRAVREALADGRDGSFIVECAPRLVDGLERLRENGIDAILLDLCLPDSRGIEAFEQVWRAAPHVPILVITSPDDEDAATQAVTRGAQDFLRRDRLDGYTLPRALKRIIERKAAEEALFFEQQRADVTLTSIGDAVLSTDLQSNVTYLNPVAERMTGWPRQEALGRPLAEVFQIIDATSRKPARNPIAQAMDLDKTVGLTPNCLLMEPAPTDEPAAVSKREVEKAVEVLTKELDPLAVSVKKAVRKAVTRAGEDVLHDKDVKDTMKKVVKKAVKEAVKEAVQDAQDVKEAKSPP